jgi:hypothetical protein
MLSFTGLAMVFAQGVLAVVFLASFLSKVGDLARFRRTVTAFDVVPHSWSGPVATLLATAEGVTVAVVLVSLVQVGSWPPTWISMAGLLLALVLLGIYTVALAAVKLRGARVACNCFGGRNTTVSWYDVARNVALLALTFVGLTQVPQALSVADRALVVLVATPLALLLINLKDVAFVALSGATD